MSLFLKKLKQTKPNDYLHIALFVFAIIPAFMLRIFRPSMWLVCEYGLEARDNGYWFYRYVCEKYPEKDIVYAIDKKSDDYKKVASLGKVISYGTFIHWVYYLAAKINISTHKGGKPNAAVCYLLEVSGLLKNKRVFLQHGITKDRVEMFFYKNTKMRLFICGAKPEYEFIEKEFGYPEGYVQLTGFARFDELLNNQQREKMILVSPTWRNWLYKVSSNPYENEAQDTKESEYYQKWDSLIHSEQLKNLLKKHQYRLVFFPHRNMTGLFENENSDWISITDWKKDDLQKLMKKAAIMITDYSSSAMDFAYMDKPVLYYQFDYRKYREGELKEGYFDYERDGFGSVCLQEHLLLEEIAKLMESDGKLSDKYQNRVDRFFPNRDQNNCERIYQQICRLERN